MRVLTRRRMAAVLLGLGALLALAVALGLLAGPSALSMGEVWSALTGKAEGAAAAPIRNRPWKAGEGHGAYSISR